MKMWAGVLLAINAVGWTFALNGYSLETNRIGQPEIVQSLGLPTDEESFNRLSPFPYSSGTHHFVSSTFPEIDSRGFHESVFDEIGDYLPSRPSDYLKYFYKTGDENGYRGLFRKKRSLGDKMEKAENKSEDLSLEKKEDKKGRYERKAEMTSGDNLAFTPKRKRGADLTRLVLRMQSKRRPEMDSMGFHGDTFGGGFGEFDTMKKRRPEMDSMGFHGDTFGGGFGEFDTMRKRRPEMDSMGFHGDTFGGGFGEFDTMKKRRPEMDSSGFHGDTFGNGFGEFDTMKKRRPEMDSSGFHGDTFGNGFGEFDTMKKRRQEMDSSGFHGDMFRNGFGEFDTMKKRRPEMDASGFHGDTFGNGFGEFDTMKKRRPEMDSSGFHGDTFGGGFGEFETMKRKVHN